MTQCLTWGSEGADDVVTVGVFVLDWVRTQQPSKLRQDFGGIDVVTACLPWRWDVKRL